MTIVHHPPDPRLLEFAAGQLDEAQNLVVAAHVAGCAACRRVVAALECVGGEMIEALPPVAMEPAAFDQVVEQMDRPVAAAAAAARRSDLPAMASKILSGYEMGAWRWSGPGIYWRPLKLPGESVSRAFLLKAEPGKQLPQHTHSGTELTLVLQGAFSHEGGRYGAGDFEDADDSILHRPVVESGDACICLVAMEGSLQLSGIIGRMLQPLVRF